MIQEGSRSGQVMSRGPEAAMYPGNPVVQRESKLKIDRRDGYMIVVRYKEDP
jgi:hypothetical protein